MKEQNISSEGLFRTEIEVGSVPMPEVILNRESLTGMTRADEFVGCHEFGHGLIAYGHGVSVSRLTIVPSPGEYRGVTVLDGEVENMRTFQLISAGGAAAVNSREGADSNFMNSELIHKYYGGYSPEQAYSIAQAMLSSITADEWNMIGKILYVKKTITGDEIPKVLERARWELKLQKTQEQSDFYGLVDGINRYVGQQETVKDVCETVVEVCGDGMIKKYKQINGIVDVSSVELYCSQCAEKNTHNPTCKYSNQSTVSSNKAKSTKN